MSSDFDLIIEPGKGIKQYWRDLWKYRELFYFLSWRDILVRYKQTVIGIAWSVVDFLISSVIFAGLMVWYQFAPGWRIITAPLFLMLALLAALGFGLWLAALNVKYRDFKYVVPFIVQFGLYISPVGFSSSIIPEKWRLLYSLNPMAGVIDGFRWALLGENVPFYSQGFLLSVALTVVIFIFGVWYFRKTERAFADII